jgi:hypothetical protein
VPKAQGNSRRYQEDEQGVEPQSERATHQSYQVVEDQPQGLAWRPVNRALDGVRFGICHEDARQFGFRNHGALHWWFV